jgi:hypothetical protein
LTAVRFSARDGCESGHDYPGLGGKRHIALVAAGLLNFSVFLRQLSAGREQLDTARRLLENARQGPDIQLVQRAMTETSEHLKVLVKRPYLRP